MRAVSLSSTRLNHPATRRDNAGMHLLFFFFFLGVESRGLRFGGIARYFQYMDGAWYFNGFFERTIFDIYGIAARFEF